MRFLMLRIQMTPSYWRAQCLIEKKKFFSLFDETNKLMASTGTRLRNLLITVNLQILLKDFSYP